MSPSFPSPILAVAAEALYQLEESNDALQGLWTVFTKCKSSIHDGHRLENATWRLWYRELSLELKSYRPPTPDSPGDVPFPAEGIGHNPVRKPTSQAQLEVPTSAQQRQTAPIAARLTIPANSTPSSPPRPSSLTKFIHDILPKTSPLTLPTLTNTATDPSITSNSATTVPVSTKAPTASHLSVAKPGAPTSIVVPGLHDVTILPKPHSTSDPTTHQASTTLPTPAAEPAYSPLASFVSVPANTVLTLPPATFPRVIIVDPTPSPTPHPTPPATPVATLSSASVNSIQKGKDHLTVDRNGATQAARHSTEEQLRQDHRSTSTPQSREQHRDRGSLPHSDGTSSSLSPLAAAQWSSSYFDHRNSSASSTSPSSESQASPISHLEDSPNGGPGHSTSKSTPVPPTKSAQSTLKPSDRRFFLQQSPEGDDTGGDASSSCNGGDGSSSNSHDHDTLPSKSDRKAKETATKLSMPPPPVPSAPPIEKAASDMASSVASNESKAHSSAGSRPNAQARIVQRKGGKIQVRAGGGKAARPPLMQRRSHSSGNFGAKLGAGLGMTSTTTATAQRGSTTELTKAASSSKSTVPKVKSTTALETATKASRQASTSGRDGKKPATRDSPAVVGNTGKKSTQSTSATRSSNVAAMAPPSLLSRLSQPQVPQVATSVATRKKIVIANTSSEYETETETESGDDDDSWASEDDGKTQVQAQPSNRSRNGRSRPTAAEIQESRRMEEVNREAQRQRDLFARVPKRTYSDIFEKKRTQTGLLTQLMHPDPSIFPPGHPYYNPAANKTSHSTQDLGSWRKSSALQTSKSVAALPLAARVQVQAGSVSAAAPIQHQPSSNGSSRPGPSSGYRPRGPPQGEEMEDDSGSESNPDDKVPLAKSLAQQKLAALAGRRSNASLKQKSQPQPPVQQPQQREESRSPQDQQAPIPVTHPYNLPVPAMPSTPRTTRRIMLQQEMSESLRRNLLWERQVSKTNISRRTHSTSSTNVHPHAHLEPARQAPNPLRRHASGGMIGEVLAPLATVRASANGQHSRRTSESSTPWMNNADQQAHERDRRRAERRETHERNRNWANDDFHTAGW